MRETNEPEPAMPLVTTPNLRAPDDFYEALIDAHRDLTSAQSQALNARLVLLLANHIGDLAVLREALGVARETGSDRPTASSSNRHTPSAGRPSTATFPSLEDAPVGGARGVA
jgi:hypothetical protein